MTHSLVDEIRDAPEDPDYLQGVVLEPEEQPAKRTRTRRASRVDGESDDDAQRSRQPRNSKLTEDLLDTYVGLASDLAVAAPTIAGVMIVRAERSIDGLVSLASGHKRVMSALRKVSKAGAGMDLIQTVFMIVVAAMVDFGRIPLDHPLLDNLGHIEVERDERGKAKRDGQGKFVKHKKSLRDIMVMMNPDASTEDTGPQQDMPTYAPPVPPQWNPTPHPSGKATIPPMNWPGGL